MPNLIELQVKDYLIEEGKNTSQRIAGNIFRNKQNATGNAINSLKSDVQSNSQWAILTISGVDYIKNLEKGTPPGTYVSVAKINQWANAKGYWEGNNYRANTISRRIFNSGSLLFRKGGRVDVYSNEELLLIERISDKVGKIIVNTQIL